mmetsp:Transcript_3034/g.5091  ORF Transcript_3034/g.5091 Transcript_3034/m.5091 type:complete len:265 (-) Transcript_3034:1204-1998(-)
MNQRRAFLVVLDVNLRAGIKQKLNGILLVAVFHQIMQRRTSVIVRHIHINLVILAILVRIFVVNKQIKIKSQTLLRRILTHQMQNGSSVVVSLGRRISVKRIEKLLEQLHIGQRLAFAHQVHCTLMVTVRQIHVGAVLQQLLHHTPFVLLNGIMQRRLLQRIATIDAHLLHSRQELIQRVPLSAGRQSQYTLSNTQTRIVSIEEVFKAQHQKVTATEKPANNAQRVKRFVSALRPNGVAKSSRRHNTALRVLWLLVANSSEHCP